MKLTSSNKDVSGDGRLKILLFLLFVLFVLDFSFQHDWSFLNGNTGLNFNKQLSVAKPNRLIVENISNTGILPGHNPVPARYTPFFFQPIPINMADKDMLMSVQGIGPAMADTIVTYRHQFGPFKKSFDLQNLKGIGPKRAVKLSKAFTF